MNTFQKLLLKDLRSSWPLFRTAFIIICCLPTAVWLFNLVLGDSGASEIAPIMRRFLIYISIALVAVMAPSRIYRTVNLPNEGIYYAMLPASKSQKFWSQVLVCYIIMPLAALIVCTVIDFFLTLLPFGSYVDHVWTYWPLLAERSDLLTEEVMGADVLGRQFFATNFWMMLLVWALGIWETASLFFFTNTIFKKAKVAKTILWIMLISFVFNLILMPISINVMRGLDWEYIMERIANWAKIDPLHAIQVCYWIGIAFHAVIIALITWWSSVRLKKMSY